MHNLNVNAIYIGEQIVDLQFLLPMNHLQRGKSTKAKISSCQAEAYITRHSPAAFLLKPPASELQLGGKREWRTEAFSQIFQAALTFFFFLSCIDYWLEKKRSLGFSELLRVVSLLKSLTDRFLSTNIDRSPAMRQALCLVSIREK